MERISARRPVRSAAALAAALVVGVVFAAGAQAAPGALDLTFSGDGKQTTDFGFGLAKRRRRWDSRTARSSQLARTPAAGRAGRLRARPLQPQRVARPELLRRRQADDRLRGLRPGERGGAPGRRQDRRGRQRPAALGNDFALARYNPNGSLDPSFSGDGKQTTDFGGSDGGDTGWRLQADGKIVAVGSQASAPATSRSPATTPTARSTRASRATASRRPTSAAFDAANGVALQGDGKIVAVGQATLR